ncbi:nuclear envelope integral membrane protein 2 isoform X4 [Saccopteryx bilineata]|uniref:nuclear envelope integral membrane protein 2 isoform X4 n=1 Tax=Saccopteryx bilineata TaxID=59482 RepID=UPI0033906218
MQSSGPSSRHLQPRAASGGPRPGASRRGCGGSARPRGPGRGRKGATRAARSPGVGRPPSSREAGLHLSRARTSSPLPLTRPLCFSRPRAIYAAVGSTGPPAGLSRSSSLGGMQPPPGPCWLLLWLPPLATLPAGAGRGQEPVAAALSVSSCKALKEMDLIKTSNSDCYCYHQNSQMEWKYIWSTLQVKITSLGLLSVVYITERHNCQYPETVLSFIKCVIHKFWTPHESHEITRTINPYGETVCFSVEPVRSYTIHVSRNIVDFRLFLVFMAGILLFFYAKTLSRSPTFYYSSGTVLGVLMTFVFLLLLVKRLIPKYSTFGALMVGCWFASVYVVCQLLDNLKWLWYEHRIYILGYVLIVGFLSFAVCYKHGPLVSERSVRLLAWTLRLLSLCLIYAGATVPQLAYAVMVLILLSRCLLYPVKAVSYLWCERRGDRETDSCITPIGIHLAALADALPIWGHAHN